MDNEMTKIEELNDFDVLRQKALVDIPSAVARLSIENDEDAAAATRLIQGINTVIRKIEDFFSPSKKAAHEAWKAVCANEATLKEFPAKSRGLAQAKLDIYLTDRRMAREAEERAAREREEAARRERERIEAEERKRQDEALAKAAAAEASGKNEEAAKILEAAVIETPPPPPAIVPAPPPPPAAKIQGAIEKKYWYAEVVDFAKLPDEFKLPNMTLLNSLAVSKKEAAAVSGVDFKWRIGSAVGRMK